MKKPNKIQLARKLLKDHGFGNYTVVRRSKKPSSKGNKYEWNMFKRFTLWASGGEKPLYYGKTSGSGAQATRTKDHRSVMVGDMMSLCPEADFLTQVLVFEFKDRLETDIFDLLKGKGSLHDWWAELKEKARKAEKNPALIFHVHGTRDDYIIFSFVFFIALSSKRLREIKYLVFEDLLIMDLECFFSVVKPWDFASHFFGNEYGKEVEKNYEKCHRKGKSRTGRNNRDKAVQKIQTGRRRLGTRRARKRLG